MLSPTMIVKVKLACSRYSSSCRPISYCGLSPVPVSPITAKRVESFASGSVTLLRRATARDSATATARVSEDGKTGSSADHGCASRPAVFGRRRRDRIGNEVDDQVGFDVAQDQVAAEEAVLEFIGQRRQLQQQARRHRRQRQRRGIVGIDGRRHFHGYLDEDGFLIFERPRVEILGDDLGNLPGGGRRKYVALMGPGAFDSNLVGERFLAPGYLFGIRGVLQARYPRVRRLMDS